MLDSLRLAILHIVELRLGGPDDDFFNAGMNSLHVLNFSAAIRRGLSEAKPQADHGQITPRLIYANPNLDLLATAILQLVNDNLQNGHAGADSHERVFQTLVDKYTAPAITSPIHPPVTSTKGLTVLLTGSTGSLGSYILDMLLADPTVSKVYCLNRDTRSETTQTKLGTARGLSTKFEKAQFLAVNLAKPILGLDEDMYQELLWSVNQIIREFSKDF